MDQRWPYPLCESLIWVAGEFCSLVRWVGRHRQRSLTNGVKSKDLRMRDFCGILRVGPNVRFHGRCWSIPRQLLLASVVELAQTFAASVLCKSVYH